MDSTIVAALISGGVGALGIMGTVVTSVVGSRNTRRATEQAIAASAAITRATLLAAHDAWLWEKRCAVYEETLAGLLLNRANRFHRVVERDWNESLEQQLEEATSDYESAQWFERMGRLYAYGTDAVLAAADAARRTHREVLDRHHELEQVAEHESALPETAPERDSLGRAGRKLTDAMEAASTAEKELRQLIREELRHEPQAAMPPPTLPAVRRGLLRRRTVLDG